MTVAKFMEPSILNNLPSQINIAKNMGPYPLYGRVWLGETSSAYGGGRKGMTDRYVAGFMYVIALNRKDITKNIQPKLLSLMENLLFGC